MSSVKFVRSRRFQNILFFFSFHLHLDIERKRKSNLLPEIPLKRNKTPAEKSELNNNPSETNQDTKDKWKKMKLPESRDSEAVNNGDGGNVKRPNSSATSAVKFSTADIGSMISSLENILKKNPLISQITSRKRKMTEDIDLK